jgi:hypothetical protein
MKPLELQCQSGRVSYTHIFDEVHRARVFNTGSGGRIGDYKRIFIDLYQTYLFQRARCWHVPPISGASINTKSRPERAARAEA